MHARLDHEQARSGDADRRVDVVDLARGLGDLGDAHRVVDGGATVDELVAADAHAQRHAVADDAPHGVDHLHQQPCAVLDGAAVLVGARVGGGGEEAANDGAVAALQFDAVEPTLCAVLGDHRVAGDDLVDLGLVDRFGHLAEQRVGHCRRCPHRHARVHAAGLTSVVVDLGEDGHAVPVNGIGDGSVAGDDVAVEPVDELLVGPVGRVCAVLLGDDEPGATGGACGVVRGMLLGGPAIARVVGEVRAEDDAVAGGDRPELQRGPQVPVGHSGPTLAMHGRRWHVAAGPTA